MKNVFTCRSIGSLSGVCGLLLLSSPLLFGETENLLRSNPGFEEGTTGWSFEKDSVMSQISAEAARVGGFGLRISDDSAELGSAVNSERVPVVAGRGYRLFFWNRVISGSGLGVYLRFYDANGRATSAGEFAVFIPPGRKGWKRFDLVGLASKDAATVEVQVRSWGSSKVVADFDEFFLESFAVEAKPPWVPSYKISPDDKSRLTEADVVGPDGVVYPSWRLAGVPGGIPQVPTVVGPDFFEKLEDQDVSARLREAIAEAVKRGGGAIELPAGKFYLDEPVILRDSGIVVRGAGREKTHLTFRGRIPYGEVRLFNWSETGEQTGPGGVVEIQANPKDLAGLRVKAGGRMLKEIYRGANVKAWGNRFILRFTGSELLSQLGAGEHELQVTATYGNGDHFSKSLKVKLSSEPVLLISPGESGIFAMVGPGRLGKEIALQEDGHRGSRKLRLMAGHDLKAGDRLQIEAPETERWNREVGNICTSQRFRVNQYEVTAADGEWITLNQPLRLTFLVEDGSFVQKVAFLERSGIEDLTLEQEQITKGPSGKKIEGVNWYPMEDFWSDGVTSSYAWGCWMRGVRVVNAGRNPIYLTRSKFCEVRDSEADGALFKGGGGTGYVGFERSFDCLMDAVVTHNMRHAPDLQWGAAGNVIRNGRFYGSDGQWHAGWTNENLFEGNLITASLTDKENGGYGFGLFASGPSSPLHGPQGPRNVAYRNDIISPKDGLHMMGGNEGWIIAYNRFRITEGRAVYGKEKSFDHIIRNNTFIIKKVTQPAVLFDWPDCTGIELLGNLFYGPVREISGFLGLGALGRDEGNRVLPYDKEAPMPKPPVESIFEWQRSTPPAVPK